MSKKCTNCQAELDDNVKFCPSCGAKVEADVPPPVILHCLQCQAKLSSEAKFCPSCGAKVEADVPPPIITHCPQCQTELAPGTKFCPSCGAKIENVQPSFSQVKHCSTTNDEKLKVNTVNNAPIPAFEASGNHSYQSSPAGYMPLPKMRSSLLYGIVAFIMSVVGCMIVFALEDTVKNEDIVVSVALGLLLLIILFVWIHQWSRNINRIAQCKIINPYVLDGILIGSAVINNAFDCKLDWGSLLVFGGILFYLDKAYKMRKADVQNCWQKALTHISIILIVDIVFSSWAALALADGEEFASLLYVIQCSTFAFLIYFMQVVFNFAICSLECQNEEYIKHWQCGFSAYHIFFKIFALFFCIILVGGLCYIKVEPKYWLILTPVLFLWHSSDLFRPKWFKKMDEEIQTITCQ